MGFVDSLRRSKSKVVLALDLKGSGLMRRALKLLDEVYDQVAAVKVNRHLSIPLSLDDLAKLVSAIHERGLPAIMDCKVNDVASTSRLMAELFFNVGFDAITACPFTGWSGGLEDVFSLAHEMDRGVILLTYMSHPGAEGTFEKVFDKILETVKLGEFDGAIVPATRPGVVRRARSALGRGYLLLAPGVGAQGARPGDAIAAGADAEIVGRAIYHPSPDGAGERARRIRDEAMEKANLRTSL